MNRLTNRKLMVDQSAKQRRIWPWRVSLRSRPRKRRCNTEEVFGALANFANRGIMMSCSYVPVSARSPGRRTFFSTFNALTPRYLFPRDSVG